MIGLRTYSVGMGSGKGTIRGFGKPGIGSDLLVVTCTGCFAGKCTCRVILVTAGAAGAGTATRVTATARVVKTRTQICKKRI